MSSQNKKARLEKRVYDIIREAGKISDNFEFKTHYNLGDLGINSLQFVELKMLIEDLVDENDLDDVPPFNIDFGEIKVSDIISLVEKLC